MASRALDNQDVTERNARNDDRDALAVEIENREMARIDAAHDEDNELLAWGKATFKPGCLIGDLARTPVADLTADEMTMLVCAREGWLVGGGGTSN